MLRLSSLLPIIEVTPVQDNEAGRKGYRQQGGNNAAASEQAAKQASLETELRPILERSMDPGLKSALSAAHDPALRGTNDPKPGLQGKLSSEQAAKSAKSASYGIVGLLNPLLDELASPASSHETRFSPTATFLASLKNENPQSNDPGHIQSATPLIREAPNLPAVLAVALRNAISQSGLFYESHLEQWLNGTRTLEAVKQEPQGKLPPILAFSPAEINSNATQASSPSIAQEPHAWLQQNLVQQLAILNNPTVVWTGQVWNGQQLTLQTTRDSPKSVDSEASWVTRLSLDMPTLGRIEVIISLDSLGVDIDIRSGTPKAKAQLQTHQLALGNRLADAGCRLRRMNVRNADGQT
jgi:hypothetical protein